MGDVSGDMLNRSEDCLGSRGGLSCTGNRSSSVGFSIIIGSFGGTMNLRFGGDSVKDPGIDSSDGSGVLECDRLAKASAYGCAGPGLPLSASRGERRGGGGMMDNECLDRGFESSRMETQTLAVGSNM